MNLQKMQQKMQLLKRIVNLWKLSEKEKTIEPIETTTKPKEIKMAQIITRSNPTDDFLNDKN
jgi:hypothetical protein